MAPPIDSSVLFLLTVILISLSGVIVPGPVFAVTIAKGLKDMNAGLKIAGGHASIEIPLIISIYFGLGELLRDDVLFAVIGLLGALILAYMARGLLFAQDNVMNPEEKETRYGSFISGAITTGVNPYFILWWSTVGAALIASSFEFGLIMLPILIVAHIGCDFIWYETVSVFTHRSKKFIDGKRHRYLLLFSGFIMLFFSVYFLLSSILKLLGS
ncbi:MAG: LysE family transporter [Methanomassiliicoccales archaeon]